MVRKRQLNNGYALESTRDPIPSKSKTQQQLGELTSISQSNNNGFYNPRRPQHHQALLPS